jgi:glucose-6-phosphate isomerase
MINLSLDFSKTLYFITDSEVNAMHGVLTEHYKTLINKSGAGNDFLGWVELPSEISNDELSEMTQVANELRTKSEVVVVIGIGGSYLGARAVIDALSDPFGSLRKNKPLQVVYAGNNLSASYHANLMTLLDEKEYSVMVISKSGTTTEPAVAFRLIKNHIEKKYGKKEAASRIIAITDKARGALKTLANKEGYKTFVIPDDVGGRFSVLTPVGLLPVAVAGFDIKKLVEGAKRMQHYLMENTEMKNNPAMQYAAVRNLLLRKGFRVEILVNFQPALYFFTEWWKQLYGESEGKENKGIFTAGVNFTTDLHSMGQYIQDGQRILFETVLAVDSSSQKLEIPFDPEDKDGLNFIAGKNLDEVNAKAETGTLLAHVDGGVPNIRIQIPEINEETIGELIYFFEFACGLSGYTLGVNPFDQPGVEAYKNNMFALLNKPGYEKQSAEIYKRIQK